MINQDSYHALSSNRYINRDLLDETIKEITLKKWNFHLNDSNIELSMKIKELSSQYNLIKKELELAIKYCNDNYAKDGHIARVDLLLKNNESTMVMNR